MPFLKKQAIFGKNEIRSVSTLKSHFSEKGVKKGVIFQADFRFDTP
jgi:hypothetical protein